MQPIPPPRIHVKSRFPTLPKSVRESTPLNPSFVPPPIEVTIVPREDNIAPLFIQNTEVKAGINILQLDVRAEPAPEYVLEQEPEPLLNELPLNEPIPPTAPIHDVAEIIKVLDDKKKELLIASAELSSVISKQIEQPIDTKEKKARKPNYMKSTQASILKM